METATGRRRMLVARAALLIAVAAGVLLMHSLIAPTAIAAVHEQPSATATHGEDPHGCGGDGCGQVHLTGHQCAGVIVVIAALTSAMLLWWQSANPSARRSRVSADRAQSGRGPPPWTVLSLAELSILRV
ncbi:DUF6153 family protein [Rhodococcus sp. USK10]|uniref:DUF6153 family protein n=1 Tax=Rhodococcus sp. USK10 TaxID=2789739 RepID=UPI0021515D6A|nr:DUF6153 family protein [Rhodococcus sp. USK10]